MRRSKDKKQTKKRSYKERPALLKKLREERKEKEARYQAWLALPEDQWSDARKAHYTKKENELEA